MQQIVKNLKNQKYSRNTSDKFERTSEKFRNLTKVLQRRSKERQGNLRLFRVVKGSSKKFGELQQW